MKDCKIKEPKQARSIEKKNRIIETGFRLFCEKGFYHTNTAEIAEAAGMSTGILYRYFPNKKAILTEAVQRCSQTILDNTLKELTAISSLSDLDHYLDPLIDSFVDMHIRFARAHQEMEAMSGADPDIAMILIRFEADLTDHFSDAFQAMDNGIAYPREKIHLIFHMIEDYCHEVAFHHHEHLDYTVMKRLLLESIRSLIRLS